MGTTCLTTESMFNLGAAMVAGAVLASVVILGLFFAFWALWRLGARYRQTRRFEEVLQTFGPRMKAAFALWITDPLL